MGVSTVAAGLTPRQQFEAFKKEHKRVYASPEEEATRFGIFYSNLERIRIISEENPSATFGITKFADLSEAEFQAPRRSPFSKTIKKQRLEYADRGVEKSMPAKIDWQARGAVTAVQNGGLCGMASYIFSLTGSIEGQWFLAGHPLTALSNEELVDCDYLDDGCNGGLMDQTYEWILTSQNGTMVTNASYPYTAGEGVSGMCQGAILNDPANVGAIISGYQLLPSGDEMGVMRRFVSNRGPLSIAVDATSFQFYTGGVITNCTCHELSQSVLITGFDSTASVPYWRIRNQWGTSWGEEGYVRVEMGSNQCCLDQLPSTALVGGNPSWPL